MSSFVIHITIGWFKIRAARFPFLMDSIVWKAV